MYPLYNITRPREQDVQDFCKAASEGDINRLTELLDTHGFAIVNEKNSLQETALQLAAFNKQPLIVERLLKRGAEVNIKRDVFGATALHWAAAQGQPDIVEMLLDFGADPSLKNLSRLTAGDLARSNKFYALADRIDRFSVEEKQAAARRHAQEEITDGVMERCFEKLKKAPTVKITIKRKPPQF